MVDLRTETSSVEKDLRSAGRKEEEEDEEEEDDVDVSLEEEVMRRTRSERSRLSSGVRR